MQMYRESEWAIEYRSKRVSERGRERGIKWEWTALICKQITKSHSINAELCNNAEEADRRWVQKKYERNKTFSLLFRVCMLGSMRSYTYSNNNNNRSGDDGGAFDEGLNIISSWEGLIIHRFIVNGCCCYWRCVCVCAFVLLIENGCVIWEKWSMGEKWKMGKVSQIMMENCLVVLLLLLLACCCYWWTSWDYICR